MYSKEIWDEIIRLHLEEGRTYQSLHEEFGPSTHAISQHVLRFRREAKDDVAQAEILASREEILLSCVTISIVVPSLLIFRNDSITSVAAV
jgi:transposase-like protein